MLSESVPRVAAQARADATTRAVDGGGCGSPRAERRRGQRSSRVVVQRTALFSGSARPRARSPTLRRGEAGRSHRGVRRMRSTSGCAHSRPIRAIRTSRDFLPSLHLSVRPPQPETARQLALHALAFSGSRRSARADDWDTLAIASALTGREVDATRALLVELAVTPDLHRSCDTVQRAYATFGERLRVPIQAMLARMRTQRRDNESPACAWLNYQALPDCS